MLLLLLLLCVCLLIERLLFRSFNFTVSLSFSLCLLLLLSSLLSLSLSISVCHYYIYFKTFFYPLFTTIILYSLSLPFHTSLSHTPFPEPHDRYFGSLAGSRFVEHTSAVNLKRTWVSYGQPRDWLDKGEGAGEEFLYHATQVKNVWLTAGDIFAN